MRKYLPAAGTFSKDPVAFGFEEELAAVRPGHHIGLQGTMRVILNDGKEYLDWVSGLGAILLGYSRLDFNEHVIKHIRNGTSFSLPHILEYQVAEKLCGLIGDNLPHWNKDDLAVRFGKTGSDVTSMAVRLARAVTGKHGIITFRSMYHGWHDWTVVRTSPHHGVPWDDVENQGIILSCDWGDISHLKSLIQTYKDEISSIIFEYPLSDMQNDWNLNLRQLCDDHGLLLIADEIVTGLRYGLGGASEYYKIEPDLVCMGKALGNGFPISALVGREEHMEWFSRTDPVFCSSTHFGETSGLAAADFVLDYWTKDQVHYLYYIGERLIQGLRDAGWNVIGHGPRSLVQIKSIYERAFFVQKMRHYGILINRPNFPSLSHTPSDVERTIETAKMVKDELNQIDPDSLHWMVQGSLPKVLFSNR